MSFQPSQHLKKRAACLLLCCLTAASLMLSGCSAPQNRPASGQGSGSGSDSASSGTVYATQVLTPKADGAVRYDTETSSLDASHAEEGYVMASYSGDSQKVKFLITTPSGAQYQYRLTAGKGYEAFPLTEGPGEYTFASFENVSGEQYTPDLSQTIQLEKIDEFGPYLYPSQYVNFTADSQVVKKALELAQGAQDDLEVLERVYSYVVEHIGYDDAKAASVQSGYVPDPDAILQSGTGICFDYAAVMASMMRSLGVPTQLQVGYMGTLYHAWISTHIKGVGWVNGVIQFDGEKWTLMDPTTAASQGEKVTAEFLKTEGEYAVKYIY